MKSRPATAGFSGARLTRALFTLVFAAGLAWAAELSEAEKAWNELQILSRPLASPRGQLSKEEQEAYRQKAIETQVSAADKAREFYTKYPNDPNAPRAQRKEVEILNRLGALGESKYEARLQELEKAKLAGGNASEDERFELRQQQLNRGVSAKRAENPAAGLAELEKAARELQQEFPNRPEPYAMLLAVAQKIEPEKGRKIMEELLKEPRSGQAVQQQAAGLLKRMDILGKPLDIQFTAVDGRKVSLAELKGKVVLIDFWATWCGPCVAELPNVIKAHESLNAKGFEIIGISFDNNKEALTKFVEQKKMPWPQYFDGKGWGNKYGQEYGINGIPAMWLVNKQGALADMDARDGLEEKVKKLLAE
jgi:thiol-disulfide isomerase/thioredoxin